MSGVTSPARPWFRLSTPDPTLSDIGPVKDWLYLVSQRMTTVFLKSNLYNVLPIIYGDIGAFGTSALFMEEDFDSVVRFYPFPIGSYCIANNHRLKVDVFTRTFRMTVRQLVNKFGRDSKDPKDTKINWSLFSSKIKSYWDLGSYETWIDVTHIIQPNENYDPKKLESKFKRYLSVYYETGSTESGNVNDPNGSQFLREKGYDYFPVLCPRWEITGEDVYGTTCPGMDALGDIKQLQLGERRTAQAIDKKINPPMVAPTSMRTQKTSILPGDVTYLDAREGMQGFKPAMDVNFSITEMENKQNQVRERIRRAFFEDLFLMLSNSDRRQITAREVEEDHEEKLLALGPVLEQLNQDLLDPLIDNTFMIMLRQSMDAFGKPLPNGLIPEAPKELHGVPLKVEYISVMAQAQKLIGIEAVERFSGFVGQVAQRDPSAADNVDVDQMIEVYGEMTGIPPGIIRPEDQVQAIRQQRQQAQQA